MSPCFYCAEKNLNASKPNININIIECPGGKNRKTLPYYLGESGRLQGQKQLFIGLNRVTFPIGSRIALGSNRIPVLVL